MRISCCAAAIVASTFSRAFFLFTCVFIETQCDAAVGRRFALVEHFIYAVTMVSNEDDGDGNGETFLDSEGVNISALKTVYTELQHSSTPSHGSKTASKTTTMPEKGAKNKRKVAPSSMEASSSSALEGGKKKKKRKRFRWSNDLHRRFMGAIFDIGIQIARPKTIFATMESVGIPDGLTPENIKSHLQKYRKNSKKSRDRFLEQFDIAFELASERKEGKALKPGFHAYPMPNTSDLKEHQRSRLLSMESHEANEGQKNEASSSCPHCGVAAHRNRSEDTNLNGGEEEAARRMRAYSSGGNGSSTMRQMQDQIAMQRQIELRHARQHHGILALESDERSRSGSVSLSGFFDNISVSTPILDDFKDFDTDDEGLFDFLT